MKHYLKFSFLLLLSILAWGSCKNLEKNPPDLCYQIYIVRWLLTQSERSSSKSLEGLDNVNRRLEQPRERKTREGI